MSVVSQHRAGEGVKKTAPQDTPARSRLIIGENGPSDSALAASSGRRLIAAQPLTGTLRAALLGPCARAAPLGAIRPRWSVIKRRRSIWQPCLSTRKKSSISHLARYHCTIVHAPAKSATGTLVSNSHSMGSSPLGGLSSVA